jgi:hypothetical protein
MDSTNRLIQLEVEYAKLIQVYSRTNNPSLLKTIQDKHRYLCYLWDKYKKGK